MVINKFIYIYMKYIYEIIVLEVVRYSYLDAEKWKALTLVRKVYS